MAIFSETSFLSMDSLRLPWRRRPSAPFIEPVLIAEQARPADKTPEFMASSQEHSCDPRRIDPILSLIGGGDVGRRSASARHDPDGTVRVSDATSSPCAADLIAALHEQYWRALTDPQASLTESWVDRSDEASTQAVARDTDEAVEDEPSAHTTHVDARSIETLLSGESTIDDCFGRLESRAAPDPDADSPPEVLRLFAPPDYRATAAPCASGHAPRLPPPLTRREHHVLSIDSPLTAPSCTDIPAMSSDEPDAAVPADAKAIDGQA